MIWFEPYLSRRNDFGMRHEDIDECKRFLKMTPKVSDELLSYKEIDITKQTKVLQELVPAKMKLTATLYYLFTGINSHL